MNETKLREAATTLKRTLKTASNDALRAFHDATGITPQRITFSMIEVSTSETPDFMVGNVQLEFRL